MGGAGDGAQGDGGGAPARQLHHRARPGAPHQRDRGGGHGAEGGSFGFVEWEASRVIFIVTNQNKLVKIMSLCIFHFVNGFKFLFLNIRKLRYHSKKIL